MVKKVQAGNQVRERRPLEWNLAETFESGPVQLQLNSAQMDKGVGYSFTIVRISGTNDDGTPRTTKFFRVDDLHHLKKILDEVEIWVDADRGERASKNQKVPHFASRA